MVHHQLPVGIWDANYRRGGGREYTKVLGMLNIPRQGFEFFFTKVGKHAAMAEQLVRDLDIEEALEIKINATLA